MTQPMKRFSWSWSRLKNFRGCPKRHYEIDLAKNFVDVESDALVWGNAVHEAMAKRIGNELALPPTMQRYEDWPRNVAALKRLGFDVSVENKMAMDATFRPTGFFDAATWFRCVIDVKLMAPQFRSALTIDWKTGATVNPEFEQLALSAQVMFVHHPEIDEVRTIYVWFGHDTQTVKTYRRDDLAEMWGQVMPTVKQMEFAHDTLTYPPKPSGLCIRHCPVRSCVYHGKGSR